MLTYLTILTLLLFKSADALSNSSNNLYFNVYRNSNHIGYHKLEFSEQKNLVTAKIEIKYDVTFLGFSVYEYYHQNEEIWEKNSLKSLNSYTDKNGDDFFCKVQKRNESYSVDGSSRKTSLNKIEIPTSYWRMELVDNSFKKTLNTQDCSVIEFNVKFLGEEMIYNNKLKTKHFKLVGKEITGEDVIIDIWYDNSGKWSKMIFLKDGSEIEYVDQRFDILDE